MFGWILLYSAIGEDLSLYDVSKEKKISLFSFSFFFFGYADSTCYSAKIGQGGKEEFLLKKYIFITIFSLN